ncbi:hypothetical protein FJZ31_11975 [Candidatus Poribacteria bacterium]|nr:hypothetical protein [Candidatus Poribacteria bacterium]
MQKHKITKRELLSVIDKLSDEYLLDVMNYALFLLQQEETELDVEAERHFKKWCAERQIKYESLSDDNVTEMIDRMIHQRREREKTKKGNPCRA